ncbi:MAG: hypothetical protein ACTSPW_18865 [Promethearchaeota archaeon]
MKKFLVIPLLFGTLLYIFAILSGQVVLSIEYGNYVVNPNDVGGLILEIIGILASLALIGIGSGWGGLNDASTELILRTFGYALLWAMLSVYMLIFLDLIGVFGYLIYIFLTILYLVGIFTSIGE